MAASNDDTYQGLVPEIVNVVVPPTQVPLSLLEKVPLPVALYAQMSQLISITPVTAPPIKVFRFRLGIPTASGVALGVLAENGTVITDP
jgi:hypothetical protein